MATAFASAIAKSRSIIYSLLYSSLLYSSLSIVSPEIPGNAAFSAYPRGYAFKTVFPLRLYCFSWCFGTTARAVSYDPFINFFHPVFHFSGHSGISAPFFCGYPRKKCVSVPKMSFYENNRAGNAVLSAFPGKILQKTAIKKEPPGPLVRGIPGGSCCYVVAAGASLANLVLDVLVGLIALDSGLREGVVIPPVDERGDCGDTSSHQLFHGAALDGQRRLIRQWI